MANILFDHGKKVGEISDWVVAVHEPVYKTFLGKTVLSVPANNECSFVSPKPVNRKSQLVVIQDSQREFVLQLRTIKGGTFVTALITSQSDLAKKLS
jgi:hypothetical protein